MFHFTPIMTQFILKHCQNNLINFHFNLLHFCKQQGGRKKQKVGGTNISAGCYYVLKKKSNSVKSN